MLVRQPPPPKKSNNMHATTRLRTVCNAWGAGPEVLADWLDKLALSGGRKATVGSTQQHDNRGSVTISTIHGAKGLEWDAVFVMRFNDGVLPSTFRDDRPAQVRGGDVLRGGVYTLVHAQSQHDNDDDGAYAAHMEEEQRLAHVACTRYNVCCHLSTMDHSINTHPGNNNRARERMYLTYVRRGMRRSPLLHEIETLKAPHGNTPAVTVCIEPRPRSPPRDEGRGSSGARRFGIVPPVGPPATGFVSARSLLAGEK